MAITLKCDRIVANAPFKISAAFEWTGATITGVRALIADSNSDHNYINPITSTINLTYDATASAYKGVLSATETIKLLEPNPEPDVNGDPVYSPLNPLKYTAVVLFFELSATDADGDQLTKIWYHTVTDVGRNVFG